MEKKYDNQNDIYSVGSIEHSYKTFNDKISNTIPNVLIPTVSKKTHNTIFLKRECLPYNLQAYLKKKLLVIEKEWIGYQLLDTLEKIHDNKLLHLNVKPSNILLDDMGIAYLCDMGFHLENLKLIEKTNRIYIDTYLKLKGDDIKYLDQFRLVELKRSSQILHSTSSSSIETVFPRFDIYPLLIILEEDIGLHYNNLHFLQEELINSDTKEPNWELSKKIKSIYEDKFKLNYQFFTDLNKGIIQASTNRYRFLIEYFFIHWEDIWRKLIVKFKNYTEFILKVIIETNLDKMDIKQTESRADIHLLLINYLIPAVYYNNDPVLSLLGLEMIEKLILNFLQENRQNDENLIYIAERIFPFLMNLFDDDTNNMILRKSSLNLFFQITNKCDFSIISEYQEYQIINYILIKLQEIFKFISNEYLISYVIDNVEIVINLITQFKHLSMKIIYQNHLENKLKNTITETAFFGKDVADIEKSIRIYEEHLKERQIESFFQKIIEQVLLMDIPNLRIKLIRNLPKLSPYFKIEYYLFIVKSLFENKNNQIIIEYIKILDNILLFDQNGDIVDLILENLKINVNQTKIKELLKQIMSLYEQGFFEEYPLIEEKLIFGPDNVFNFIWIAKGSLLVQFKSLISYLIKHNLPMFYMKVQKFIIPYFTKEKDEFLLTEKDLVDYTEKNSRRSSERLSVSSSSSISVSSVYVRNLLDINKISFTIHDFTHQNIIQLYAFEKYIVVFREHEGKACLSLFNVKKNLVFKYKCDLFDTIYLDQHPPCLDCNLCFMDKGVFYYLEEKTKNLFSLDILNQKNRKNYEILHNEGDTILFIIKIVNSSNIMIITNARINFYSLEFLKNQSETLLSPLNGKILCYDFTKDLKQIIFGTNLGYVYIYDIKNSEIKTIQLNEYSLPIINLKTTFFEGINPCILVQFKTKMLNYIDSYILSEKPVLNNKFSITRNNTKEEISFDINTICSEFEHNKIFFSGGKDLIYWDFNPIEIKEKSRNLSDISLEKQVESIKHLHGFSSTITVHESNINNHTYIKKIVSFKEDSSNILFSVHVDGTISLWS